MTSMVWCLHAGPWHVSCGMADTLLWEVLAFARRVRDLTDERRMESLGFFFAAREGGVRARVRRTVVRRCIVVCDCLMSQCVCGVRRVEMMVRSWIDVAG